MNDITLTVLLSLISLIAVGVLVYTFRLGAYRQKQPDEGVSPARVKYRILLNPIFWAYILVPIAIILGVYIVYVLFG